jgi:hypothetical protein
LGRYVSPHPPSHTSHLFILFFLCVQEQKMNRCCVCLEMLWAVPRL